MTELVERDWSGAAHDRCVDCGFDAAEFRDRDLATAIRALGDRWAVFFDPFMHRPGWDNLLRARPHPDSPSSRSALEVACHVRDTIGAVTARVKRTLAEDHPELDWPDAEPTGSGDDDPHDVVIGLETSTDNLAEVLRRLPSKSWIRTATRRGHELTVAGLTRFALHEGHHHLIEAERAAHAALAALEES